MNFLQPIYVDNSNTTVIMDEDIHIILNNNATQFYSRGFVDSTPIHHTHSRISRNARLHVESIAINEHIVEYM